MDSLPGISHVDLLKLVFSIAVLLGTARIFAEMMIRVGQPAVVGEILAGVVLGPSLISGFFPVIGDWIVPQTQIQGQLLDVAAVLGIILLILLVGMETDLALIRRRVRTATAVGLGGLAVPFAAGFAFGRVFPAALLVDPDERLVFSLFLAVALALSAIPVLAKILGDLGLMRKQFGQTALAAGMIDDILGWTLLGIVTSLAAAGEVELTAVLATVGSILLFLAATLLVARPLANWSLAVVQDHSRVPYRLLTLVVVFAFGWGAFSQALHLEPILGAFAAGIIFGQSRRLPIEVSRQLESVTYGVFAPIFLATAGLRLDLGVILEPDLLAVTAALVAVAATGKLVGSYLGARLFAGSSIRESIAFGIALNARGVLGIIVGAIGLSMGVFSIEVYSMIVVVSVVTSLTAPIGLKRVLFRSGMLASGDERNAPLESVRRVLLPVRPRETKGNEVHSLEFAILNRLSAARPAVTLFSVVRPDERKAAAAYLASLSRLLPQGTQVSRRIVAGEAATSIVDEASNGYDLIALGSPEAEADRDYLFDSVVDDVVRLAPCPSLIFRARGGRWPIRTILVPATGSSASANAARLAYAIGGSETHIVLFHVVDIEATQISTGRSSSPVVRLEIAQSMVDALREIGEPAGAKVSTEVIQGGPTIPAILERATRDIDLVILGTSVRAGSGHLYLGPKVERLLRDTPCSVVIYNV